MSKISFSDFELRKMKEFYEDELERAQSKVLHIKDVLTKLGSSIVSPQAVDSSPAIAEIPTVADAPVVKGKRGRKPKDRSLEVAVEAPAKVALKRGPKTKIKPAKVVVPKRERKKEEGRRKSKWTSYILDVLDDSKKFYATNDIIDNALKSFKLTGKEAVSLKNTLQATLFRLSKENQIQTYRIKGERTSYWATLGLTNYPESTKLVEVEPVKAEKKSKAPVAAKEDNKKSKWTSFVNDFVNTSVRYVTTDEVITAGLKAYKLSSKEKDTARNTLQATLHRLSKEGQILSHRKKGIRMSFWGKKGLEANNKTVIDPKSE